MAKRMQPKATQYVERLYLNLMTEQLGIIIEVIALLAYDKAGFFSPILRLREQQIFRNP